MGAIREIQRDASVRWACDDCDRTYRDLGRWMDHPCAQARQQEILEAGGAFAMIERQDDPAAFLTGVLSRKLPTRYRESY